MAETLAAPLAGPEAVATAISHHAGGIQVGSLSLGRFQVHTISTPQGGGGGGGRDGPAADTHYTRTIF